MNASYKIEQDGDGYSVRLGDHERPFIGGFASSHEAAEWVLAFYQTSAEISARRERRSCPGGSRPRADLWYDMTLVFRKDHMEVAMAKLEVVHRTEVEMVFVATPVKKYVLELSQDEAEVLAGLLYRVGGRPEGPRGKLQQVFSALESAGVAPREMTINNTRFAACMVS